MVGTANTDPKLSIGMVGTRYNGYSWGLDPGSLASLKIREVQVFYLQHLAHQSWLDWPF